MKKTIYITLYILSISCGQYNSKLENALKQAGDNREELKKVLCHYSQNPADSLKLRAAEFLIENMPGHYTLEGYLINSYRERIYSDTTASYFAKKALDISLSNVDQLSDSTNKKEDVRHIKANFPSRRIHVGRIILF